MFFLVFWSSLQLTTISLQLNMANYAPRFDLSSLSLQKVNDLETSTPFIVRNAFPDLDCDKWTESMLHNLGDELVEYDSRNSESKQVDTYECTFNEFLQCLPENSDHIDSMYMMSEDLLRHESMKEASAQLRLPTSIFGQNIFDDFPAVIRPSNALIVGGVGARSFLHADPFEWTGYNLLLEGQKLWCFLPPMSEDICTDFLQTIRKPANAWGEEHTLAAGWVSPIDLYRKKLLKPSVSPLMAQYTKSLEDPNCTSCGYPHYFSSEDPILEAEENFFPEGLLDKVIYIVQEAGDTVMIPNNWFHQVYHLQPSVAVAGQYANDHLKQKVFNHIVNWGNQLYREGEMEGEQIENENKSEKKGKGEGKGKKSSKSVKSDVKRTEQEPLSIPDALYQLDTKQAVAEVVKLGLKAQVRDDRLAQEIFADMMEESREIEMEI